MFGLVTASLEELRPEEKERYQAVYCGLCRAIGDQDGQLCRLGLSYDLAFLALVLTSLYEPEETAGAGLCVRHPVKKQPWVDNEYIRYAARMNVILARDKAADDWNDEKSWSAWALSRVFGVHGGETAREYPRQTVAIAAGLAELSRLEGENCPNPDLPANAFGEILGELMVFREDRWAPLLRELGFWLGRFIYLADAAMDYDRDGKQGKYNPYLAMGMEADFDTWERHLVLSMAGCTRCFEALPLVTDKGLLDNILYSGVWLGFRARQRKIREEQGNGGSL